MNIVLWLAFLFPAIINPLFYVSLSNMNKKRVFFIALFVGVCLLIIGRKGFVAGFNQGWHFFDDAPAKTTRK
jgi:hypothetical protein